MGRKDHYVKGLFVIAVAFSNMPLGFQLEVLGGLLLQLKLVSALDTPVVGNRQLTRKSKNAS